MKYIVTYLFLCLLLPLASHAQWPYQYNTQYVNINLDSDIVIPKGVHSPNVWQIGRPHKKVFDSAVAPAKVLVTDTAHTYPKNDTSVFIIKIDYNKKHLAQYGTPGAIWFQYYMNSDTLKDYGAIDVSVDSGRHWVNFVRDTLTDNHLGNRLESPLTGNTNGWMSFMKDLPFMFDSAWHWNRSDTINHVIFYRFSFISDSTDTHKDGMMIKNMTFGYWHEGINEIGYTLLKSTIMPNPAQAAVTLTFDNPHRQPFNLLIYDNTGKTAMQQDNITAPTLTLNTTQLPAGLYHYTLTNSISKQKALGQFVISR